MGVAREVPQIRQERVAAVEHAQFHLLPRQNILHHLNARDFPLRTAGNKIIFHHPLNKRFTADGARIFNAERVGDFRQRGVRRGGNNSVDHRPREAHVAVNPFRQRCGTLLRHAQHRVFHHVPVIRDIVAGEHGKRRQAALVAAVKRFDQDPGCGMWL